MARFAYLDQTAIDLVQLAEADAIEIRLRATRRLDQMRQVGNCGVGKRRRAIQDHWVIGKPGGGDPRLPRHRQESSATRLLLLG
jgi:hypothetical protein